MAHTHEGHEGHSHGVNAGADSRYLAIGLALLVGFMLVEVVVGVIASSLALISDAGHMLTDAGAIGLALLTMRLAARPAQGAMTYGLKRVEILSAQANGITLLLLSAWFVYEVIRRLIYPPEVEGGLVLGIALLGIVVNVVATWTISRANRESLNVEGAFQHILTDLFAFIATAIAGAIIYFTGGYNRVDAIATLVVAGLMLRAGYRLVRDSGRIFMEAAPKGLDPEEVGHAIASPPQRGQRPRPARLGGDQRLSRPLSLRASRGGRRLPRRAAGASTSLRSASTSTTPPCRWTTPRPR